MKSSVILGSAALLFFVILLASLDFTAGQDASQTNAPTKGHLKPQSRGSDVDDFIPYQGIRYNTFDWMLLRTMNKRYKGNILISPISLKLALVLLYEGAQYETAEELAGVLQLPISYSATRERFGNILQSLKAPSPDYKLNIGTQVYIDEDHPARQLYRAIVKMFYESDVHTANFSEPQTIAEQANNWVYNITEGNIPTLIKNSDSLQNNVMLILNAMFFKGSWRHKYFRPENTQIRQFYVDNNTTVDVPYMQGVGQFYYAESPELNAKILRIPYAGQKFAMYLVLPYSSNGADSLLDRLDPFVLNKHVWLMHETQVYVSIPKFKFTFSSHLKEVLRELGIQSIFADTAMLSGIARTKADSMRLKVSDVFQKTGIDVNENGTTAYAATEVQVVNKFGAEDFNVDHPFVFYIEDETTGTTLYAGKVSNPLEVERNAEAPRSEFPEAPSAASAEKSNTEKPSTGNVAPRIGERYNYFNVELLHTLIEDNDENLIVSPASAKLALAILGEGTGGRTRQELLSALRLPNDNAKIRETVHRSIAALKKNENGTELSAHSSLWIQEQLNILSEYKNVVEQQYDTNIQSLNFANTENAADTINAWVRSVTRHKINSLVDAGSFHPGTRLLLTSALYFKGQWRTAFNKYLTRIRCFNVPNNGCKNASFMAITSMFPYANVSSLDAQVIGLQYSDQRTMMLIVLPNHAETDHNLRILSKDLSYIPVSTLLSNLQTTEVNVLLPKFSINSKLDLRSSLSRIGIRDLFEMSANLSGIVNDDSLRVASVVQNAKIEVDEDGTVAAAVTGISVVPLIASSTLVFNANRPFIFMIVDSDTKETLFSGRFMQPN